MPQWLLKLLFLGWNPWPNLTNVVQGIYGTKDSPDLRDTQSAAGNTGASDVQANIASQYLNRPDESTPYGSRTWTTNGYIDIPSIGGVPGYRIPRLSSSESFTPLGQQQFDLQNNVKTGLLQQGQDTMGQVRDSLSSPLDLSGAPGIPGQGDLTADRDSVTNALFERSMRLLNPQFNVERNRTEADLIGRGFSVGNEGYTKAYDDMSRRQGAQMANAADTAIAAGGAEQSRISQLAMQQRQQAISEILAKRNQPLTELNTLMTGGAPTAPSFQNFSATANIDPANFLGGAAAQNSAELSRYGLETTRMNDIHKGIMDIWKQAEGGSFGGSS